jgi:Clostripain family
MAKTNKPDYLWTVMVYLAGDNNLTEESVFSLTEMKEMQTDGRIAVIVQFDPKASRVPTHRYVLHGARAHRTARGRAQLSPVTATLDARPLEEPKIKFPRPGAKARAQHAKREDGETNSADPATLFDFISWTQEHFSAERYMVILAGHGAGTEEDFLLADENPMSSLSIPALRDVFEAVQETLPINIDILGMDVCLMSMVEVCYELNGFVDYLVSSESFSPAAGWPYGHILEKIDATLQENKKAGTEELA